MSNLIFLYIFITCIVAFACMMASFDNVPESESDYTPRQVFFFAFVFVAWPLTLPIYLIISGIANNWEWWRKKK